MDDNYLIDSINKVVNYIEDNIELDLTLKDISNFSHISEMHLHRIFKAITSKKLMNYAKNRKLTHSIDELLKSNLRIIDIANNYGFDYEQSYIRAFKRSFGLSPDEFRKQKCQITITDKLDLKNIVSVGEDSILLYPQIVLKPDFFIAGIRHYVDAEENEKNSIITKLANEFSLHHTSKIPNRRIPSTFIGLVEYTENLKYFFYTTSIETTEMTIPAKGMVTLKIPTHKYAVFKYIGLHHPGKITAKDLLSIYNAWNQWICNSNYYQAAPFHLEKIDTNITKDDYCEVDLLVPVKERNT